VLISENRVVGAKMNGCTVQLSLSIDKHKNNIRFRNELIKKTLTKQMYGDDF